MGLSSSCCPKMDDEVIISNGISNNTNNMNNKGSIRRDKLCKDCKKHIINKDKKSSDSSVDETKTGWFY